jgi:hypothetical protein
MKTFAVSVSEMLDCVEVKAENFKVDELGNLVFFTSTDHLVAAFKNGEWL